MKVRVLAKTEVEQNQPELAWEMLVHDADYLAEFAGRACYQSWAKPNPATATNDAYLRHILDVGHFSVLEHASVTFYIEGVSRSLTHELIRHRHFSYSQLSQRFVDESFVDSVIPPAIRDLGDINADAVLDDVMRDATNYYGYLVGKLEAAGLPRKQAREAARAVLPNMTETKIVVSGNHRAWREFLAKRNAPGADKEIQELSKELLVHLKRIAPNTYQDM